MKNENHIIIPKNVWGPVYWDFLYVLSLTSPQTLTPKQKQLYTLLISNFSEFLPCKECRENYKYEIDKINININDRSDLLYLILHLHNSVRVKQQKKKFTVHDVKKYFLNYKSYSYVFTFILCLLLINALRCYFFV